MSVDTPLVDLFSIERVRTEKIYLDDFVDEFDSRQDNRRSYTELIMI